MERNGQTSILRKGETAVIEPGVWHDWCNAGPRDARVRVEITPGERSVHMIETFYGLARLGHTDRRGMPSPLQLALSAREFSDVIVFRAPPLTGATCDLWRSRTAGAQARLSCDVPAAFAHRAGAMDLAQRGRQTEVR